MDLLNYLLHFKSTQLWLIFFAENLLITIVVMIAGHIVIKAYRQHYPKPSARKWLICLLTNAINTGITYIGFWLFKHHYITIEADLSLTIISDFLILFFAMDILMYAFHYFIHHSFLYRHIHYFHHLSVNPTPIDLFILHPTETIAFGALWLIVLLCHPFNAYAIALYLMVNVIFGMIGHLGTPAKPGKPNIVSSYLGTSAFHHNHHKELHYNYGFYTSIWDRILGTYKDV